MFGSTFEIAQRKSDSRSIRRFRDFVLINHTREKQNTKNRSDIVLFEQANKDMHHRIAHTRTK